jgi:predicted transcriptional regulator
MTTTLQQLVPRLQAQILVGNGAVEITGCYISDLLSDVLAHAGPGVLWLTVQTHHTVVSVAATKDCAAVLFTCGRKPMPDVIAAAEEQGIALLTTKLTSYEAAGRLWEAGIRP